MTKITNIASISQLNDLLHQPKSNHPLVSVLYFSEIEYDSDIFKKFTSELYAIILKNQIHGTLKYGKQNYSFQEGTLIFASPGQVVSFEEDFKSSKGIVWGLFFHPDLILDTSLSSKMSAYSFFSYDAHEALNLSNMERQNLSECIVKINRELIQETDNHSQNIITANIELLLNYCNRYYDRLYTIDTLKNTDILSQFENVLQEFFNSDIINVNGLPSVRYFAEKLNISPNYLSDLLKKETGKNTQEHIHYQLLEKAKNRLLISANSVSEIAYELGFNYPQYFSRFFKKHTGMTPSEYRDLD